jgi:hypothetical protein
MERRRGDGDARFAGVAGGLYSSEDSDEEYEEGEIEGEIEGDVEDDVEDDVEGEIEGEIEGDVDDVEGDDKKDEEARGAVVLANVIEQAQEHPLDDANAEAFMRVISSPIFTDKEVKMMKELRQWQLPLKKRAEILIKSGIARKVIELLTDSSVVKQLKINKKKNLGKMGRRVWKHSQLRPTPPQQRMYKHPDGHYYTYPVSRPPSGLSVMPRPGGGRAAMPRSMGMMRSPTRVPGMHMATDIIDCTSKCSDSKCSILGGKRKTKSRHGRKTRSRKNKTHKKRWSMKYKRSINCRHPRGFSQRQHCKYGRRGWKSQSSRD